MIVTQHDIGKTVFCIDDLSGCIVKAQIAGLCANPDNVILSKPCGGSYTIDRADLLESELDAVAPLYAMCL